MDMFQNLSLEEWIGLCLGPLRDFSKNGMEPEECGLFLVCLLYTIWSTRNKKLFEGKKSFQQHLAQLNATFEEFNNQRY